MRVHLRLLLSMFGMLQGVDTAHGEAKGCTRGASLGRCLYIS